MPKKKEPKITLSRISPKYPKIRDLQEKVIRDLPNYKIENKLGTEAIQTIFFAIMQPIEEVKLLFKITKWYHVFSNVGSIISLIGEVKTIIEVIGTHWDKAKQEVSDIDAEELKLLFNMILDAIKTLIWVK